MHIEEASCRHPPKRPFIIAWRKKPNIWSGKKYDLIAFMNMSMCFVLWLSHHVNGCVCVPVSVVVFRFRAWLFGKTNLIFRKCEFEIGWLFMSWNSCIWFVCHTQKVAFGEHIARKTEIKHYKSKAISKMTCIHILDLLVQNFANHFVIYSTLI